MISDKRFIVYDYGLKTVAYAYIRKVKSPLVIGLTSECRKFRKSFRLKSNLLAYTKTLVELIIRLQY